MHLTLRQKTGFTLVELIISVGLLSLLMILIGQLFNESQSAVSTSIRSSAVFANTRSMGEQFSEDFKNMVGPNSTANEVGGFLVIVNQRINNVEFPEPAVGGTFTAPIRSDHIAFLRTADRLTPMTPRNANSYGNPMDTATHARVAYGHAVRTNRDGSATGNGIGQANSGFDRIATDLILGRQALLMATPVNPATATANQFTTNDRHVQGFAYNANVVSPQGAPSPLFRGATDVMSTAGFLPNNVSGVSNFFRNEDNTNLANANAAYRALTFVDNRLQVNPVPADPADEFDTWKIAQTHGIFGPNCSEFVVQFAGDLNNDGELDKGDNGTPGENDDFIIWYDAFNGNLPANPWGGMTNGGANTYVAGAGNGPHVFVFRVGDDGSLIPGDANNSKWPMLIRIRYRLHDSRGKIMSNDPAALVDDGRISGRWFEHIYRVKRPKLPTTPTP